MRMREREGPQGGMDTGPGGKEGEGGREGERLVGGGSEGEQERDRGREKTHHGMDGWMDAGRGRGAQTDARRKGGREGRGGVEEGRRDGCA